MKELKILMEYMYLFDLVLFHSTVDVYFKMSEISEDSCPSFLFTTEYLQGKGNENLGFSTLWLMA